MKINITSEVLSKMNVLSTEYRVEVGGYLTGELKDGEMFIDGLLIPNQRIGPAVVEIGSEGQVDLLRKYGKKCQKIIGHWHSHHSMGCCWSTTDVENMQNIMEYKKLYVFIVSSLGKHLIKVCMNEPLRYDFNDVDLFLRTTRIDKLRSRMNRLIKENEAMPEEHEPTQEELDDAYGPDINDKEEEWKKEQQED